jgi:hypothetical protein
LSGTDYKGPKPGDFPLNSPESRAAARALIEGAAPGIPKPPNIFIAFVHPTRGRLEPVRAMCQTSGQAFERANDESAEDFKRRIARSLPKRKWPHLTILWPERSPAEA